MKIMMVENEKPLMDLIVDFFDDIHEFETFVDLDSALTYVSKSEPPDLVMLDLRMNGKNRNGFEVYKLARSTWGPSVPFAIVTGCDDELLDEAEDLAKHDLRVKVYRKPFGSEECEVFFAEAKAGSSEEAEISSPTTG